MSAVFWLAQIRREIDEESYSYTNYLKMPLKCCVPNCNSNYKTSKEKVSVYKFPRDEEEKKKWKSAIPRANLEVTSFTAVCRHHWPDDCEFITVYGKSRPADPPSVFKNIPISCLSSPPLKARKIEKTSAASRSVQPDQLSEFQQLDKLVLGEIPTKLSSDDSLVVFKLPAAFVIQSLKFHEGVPEFVITISEDYSYSLFYYGSSCSVPSLSNNKINQCKNWSTLYEIIRYAKAKEKGHKTDILLRQVSVSGKKNVAQTLYSPEAIARAFEYFCISRSLYHRLREDFQLPSVRTLTRITSKIGSVEDVVFTKGVIQKLPATQKRYVSTIS